MKTITLKNGERVLIREAKKEDAGPLLGFLDKVCGETDNLTFGPGEMSLTVEQEESFLESIAKKEGSIFLVAVMGENELVGTTHFMAGAMPRTKHAGEFGISILKAHWAKGLGAAMMDVLFEWIRSQKTIRKANLKVRADNLNAIHLYEKFGFVHEGRITREYYIKDEYHDVLCMGLHID